MKRTAFAALWCHVLVVLGLCAQARADEPIQVQLVVVGENAQLYRGGVPFQVKGAGGDESFAILAGAGGNTARTWGVGADTQAILDEAHANGLGVAFGIWLGHERHGFDYDNPRAVAAQLEAARQAVLQYKDHPAVLVWGIGNEMEGFGQGDNDKIWDHVEDVAAMIKSIDPNHPTMTTIAEIGGARIPKIHQRCPSIDIVGINTYGGVTSIPQRYRSAGGTKPYMVTEYGIWGDTETGQTPWGEPYEPSSTTKGPVFANAYGVLANDPLCLGSIAFVWGDKREATITWHGMFLEDGSKLQAVDELTVAWGGPPLTNRCPVIESFGIPGNGQFDSGDTITVNLNAYDPDGDPLTFEYVLMGETDDPGGGDGAGRPPSYPSALVSSGPNGATLTAPVFEKAYRLYVFVRDGNGAAATASAPLYVFAVDDPEPEPPVELPAYVYADNVTNPYWNPTGYMGDIGAIGMNLIDLTGPASGPTALRVDFNQADGWGGVVWQNPDNNWGAEPGGINLTGVGSLRFMARGAQGGEVVTFGYGLIGPDADYPDSSQGEREITLTDTWQEYSIVLSGKDMSSIISGFYWIVGGQGAPVTFYLDDIRYQSCEPADLNGDANLNNTDINAFVAHFILREAPADVNSDGNWNNTDINLFVQAFFAGCGG